MSSTQIGIIALVAGVVFLGLSRGMAADTGGVYLFPRAFFVFGGVMVVRGLMGADR